MACVRLPDHLQPLQSARHRLGVSDADETIDHSLGAIEDDEEDDHWSVESEYPGGPFEDKLSASIEMETLDSKPAHEAELPDHAARKASLPCSSSTSAVAESNFEKHPWRQRPSLSSSSSSAFQSVIATCPWHRNSMSAKAILKTKLTKQKSLSRPSPCQRWNFGTCRGKCKYQHVCHHCGHRGHKAASCPN